MILVMAEEFEKLPRCLQRISSKLIDSRKSRTAVICGVIVLMSLTSSISLIDIDGHNPNDVSKDISKKAWTAISTIPSVSPMEPLPIILNLSLKTHINNSIIINVNNENKTHCGDKCIKNLIGSFNGIVTDAENITRLANETSNILQDLNRKLSDLKQGKYHEFSTCSKESKCTHLCNHRLIFSFIVNKLIKKRHRLSCSYNFFAISRVEHICLKMDSVSIGDYHWNLYKNVLRVYHIILRNITKIVSR